MGSPEGKDFYYPRWLNRCEGAEDCPASTACLFPLPLFLSPPRLASFHSDPNLCTLCLLCGHLGCSSYRGSALFLVVGLPDSGPGAEVPARLCPSAHFLLTPLRLVLLGWEASTATSLCKWPNVPHLRRLWATVMRRVLSQESGALPLRILVLLYPAPFKVQTPIF